jgi:hypothetical protein
MTAAAAGSVRTRRADGRQLWVLAPSAAGMGIAAATLASPALAPLAASTRTVSAAAAVIAAAITTAMTSTGAGAFVADRCGLGSVCIFGGIVPRVAPARAPCPADLARVGTSYIAGVGIAGTARGGDPAAVHDAGLPASGRGTCGVDRAGTTARSSRRRAGPSAAVISVVGHIVGACALFLLEGPAGNEHTGRGEAQDFTSHQTITCPLLRPCRPMNSLSYPHGKERSALQCRQHRVRPRNERGNDGAGNCQARSVNGTQ